MSMITLAYLVIGKGFDSKVSRVSIERPGSKVWMIGVNDMEDAKAVAKELVAEGVDALEVCGGFGEARVRELIEAIDGAIPIGHVTTLPSEREKMQAVFTK